MGVRVSALEMRRGRPSALALWRLVRLIQRETPDVIQTWLYHADLAGLIAGRLARSRRVVWNLRASNMDMSYYARLSGWTVRGCAALSGWPAAVIVNSEAGQAFHIRRGYHPRRWSLIPNGIDTNRFAPDAEARLSVRRELGLREDAILIGFIARYDAMKDHATFLRAASLYGGNAPGAHFLLAGEQITADNLPLVAAIAEAGLSGRVHLLGRRGDIPRLTAALDLATSSSMSEGFPNVLAEAMACDVPCVVTAAGDSAKIVGEHGIVVPVRDPQALADGWQTILGSEPERRQAIGRAAREHICRHYSLIQMIQQYESLYASLVAEIS
jgi:glycosyltransferase involved in cell wall biosynthesis